MPSLDWIVLKVAQRCNLNCTYCYVYNRGDNGWKARPKFISEVVIRKLAERIAEHCGRHGLDRFNIEFHGGEPLLLGHERFRAMVELLVADAHPVRLKFHLQTNGLLLDPEWVKLFDEFGISFGISLDGPPELADQHRVDHRGAGSTHRVVDNIRTLYSMEAFRDSFGGILAVLMDLDSCSPEALLDWFADLHVPSIDLLLPDGNYADPPPGAPAPSRYGDFLIRAFDHWLAMDSTAPNVRLFDHLIRGMWGEAPSLDSLGGDIGMLCVIETDGTIGESDVGRICPPLRVDRLSIFSNALEEHSHASVAAQSQALCATCLTCPVLHMCGGGYLPHRFDGVSFQNPSYYCEALKRLCTHIRDVVLTQVQAAQRCPVSN